jgi:biofilm PGA synthesis N-glycosyltransferase PgaC
MMTDFFRPMIAGRAPSLLPTYINNVLAVLWAYAMVFSLGIGLLGTIGLAPPGIWEGFQLVPAWWGLTLSLTYLAQALVSYLVERRYEPEMLRTLFWIIWYPLAFWMISTMTAVAALPRALFRPRKERTTWVSPDRGLR